MPRRILCSLTPRRPQRESMLYTWGANKSGELGHGDVAKRAVPRLVKSVRGARCQIAYERAILYVYLCVCGLFVCLSLVLPLPLPLPFSLYLSLCVPDQHIRPSYEPNHENHESQSSRRSAVSDSNLFAIALGCVCCLTCACPAPARSLLSPHSHPSSILSRPASPRNASQKKKKHVSQRMAASVRS